MESGLEDGSGGDGGDERGYVKGEVCAEHRRGGRLLRCGFGFRVFRDGSGGVLR